MDLLKQTSLILGLAALTLGVWTLFRDWRNRNSVLFSFLCFLVTVWALSFVSHATLFGRLSYDIHLFCNVFLAPTGVLLMSSFLARRIDAFSRFLFMTSLAGGAVLGFMIAFSLGQGPGFRRLTEFWPSFILIEYLHLLFLEYGPGQKPDSERIPPGRRFILYLGPAVSLAFCTFDHLPFMGFVVPSIGNLLFALYLFAASRIINPRKWLGLESVVSRLFAVLTLSLVLTGFFALLYNSISRSFPLFLLNSFLISFAVLALWNPLVTFFRFLGRSVLNTQGGGIRETLEHFRILLSGVTTPLALEEGLRSFFLKRLRVETPEVTLASVGVPLPRVVEEAFAELHQKSLLPLLHRGILNEEREALITREDREKTDLLLEYLDAGPFDFALAAFAEGRIVALIRGVFPGGMDRSAFFHPFLGSPGLFSELGECTLRLARIREAQERERLILLGEMAAGLAHEIRNPLGAIQGAADLVQDEGPWVGVIRDETERLNRLVGQFLDFSRSPHEGRLRIELNALLPRAVQNLKFLVSRDITLRFEPGPDPVWIEAVPDSIQQVLHNLVQNAVKAVEGVASPEIRIRVLERGFSVTDNGIGMSEEIRVRVFEPFFTSFKNGTGLGLSICERLIRHDRGSLQIESVPGVGTEVEVRYPDAG